MTFVSSRDALDDTCHALRSYAEHLRHVAAVRGNQRLAEAAVIFDERLATIARELLDASPEEREAMARQLAWHSLLTVAAAAASEPGPSGSH